MYKEYVMLYFFNEKKKIQKHHASIKVSNFHKEKNSGP